MGQFENSHQLYLSEKRRNNIGNPEHIKLVPIYEAKSGTESTMDQELDIRNRVYEIGTYNMRRVCVTIKIYNVNKPPYIQIRLFTAKENGDLMQVTYVNYTLNEFKELSQVLGDFMIVDNCKHQ